MGNQPNVATTLKTRLRYSVLEVRNVVCREDAIVEIEQRVTDFLNTPGVSQCQLGTLIVDYFPSAGIWRAEQAVSFLEHYYQHDPKPEAESDPAYWELIGVSATDKPADKENPAQLEVSNLPPLSVSKYSGFGVSDEAALDDLATLVYQACFSMNASFDPGSVQLSTVVFTYLPETEDLRWKATQTVTGRLLHPPDPPPDKEKTIKPQKSSHGLLLPVTLVGQGMTEEDAVGRLKEEIGTYITENKLDSVLLGPRQVTKNQQGEFFLWTAEQEITSIKRGANLYPKAYFPEFASKDDPLK